MMLAELPPTPAPAASTSAAPATIHPTTSARHQSPPPRSPRKSPGKRKAGIAAGRVASGKKTRVSRRSSGLGLSPSKKVIPPFETEVIPSSLQIPGFKASISLPPSQPPIAAPVFVLPPPSPAASLRKHVPPEAEAPQPPMLQAPVFLPNSVSDSAVPFQAETPAPIATSKSAPAIAPAASVPAFPEAGPSTPLPHRPFPMAKPLAAARMIHAYSPAKPSPLSRILMLANSPESPDIERPQLGALDEEIEGDEEDSPTPAATVAPPVLAPTKSLAEELGVSEGDDSPPALREKKTQVNTAKRSVRPAAAPRVAAKEKGKAKAEPPKPAAAASRTRPAGTLEKENVKRAKLSGGAGAGSANGGASTAGGKSTAQAKPPSKPFSKPAGAGRLAPGKSGPRRVPIGSAEAAPVGRMWKG